MNAFTGTVTTPTSADLTTAFATGAITVSEQTDEDGVTTYQIAGADVEQAGNALYAARMGGIALEWSLYPETPLA